MTDNIKTLPGVNRPSQLGEPNIALIGMLENALERAKSGQLQSLIAAGHTSEGDRFVMWGPFDEDVYRTLGSLTWLQHEYVARMTGEVLQTGRPA